MIFEKGNKNFFLQTFKETTSEIITKIHFWYYSGEFLNFKLNQRKNYRFKRAYREVFWIQKKINNIYLN